MAELIDITIPGQQKSHSLKDITIIGRASTTDIKLDDPKVSRHHARISKSDTGYFIEDLGSLNGVFIDNELIISSRPLSNGNKVCIGSYTLIFKDTEPHTTSTAESNASVFTQIIRATRDQLKSGKAEETIFHEAVNNAELEQLQRRLTIFHDITKAISDIFNIDALLDEIIQIIFTVFPHAGRCFVALQDSEETPLSIRTLQTRDASLPEGSNILSQTLAQRAIKEQKALLIMDTQMDSRVSTSIKIIGARSILCAPLICPQKTIGILQIESKSKDYEFSESDLDLFTGIASQVALLIYNAELLDDLKKTKERVESENRNLKRQQKVQSSFSSIVGNSSKLREILELVRKVSNAPYSVLITGESGSGKELIAKAIHYNSQRAGQPFVVLNCAAIPKDLLESELFGHEKGSFTGATETRQGLFEVANNGTVFLDEIGDMNPHTQAKLLRILQEREFQRVGGTKVIKIDVRVLAATNKDLKAAISNGGFREDLFYRLNVVPIHIPPLRERKEDISLLMEHFLSLSCTDVGKRISGFTAEALTFLINYNWPGNVRELKNVIERIVTLAHDESAIGIEMLPPEIYNKSVLQVQKYKTSGNLYEAQKQLEVEMIVDALKTTKGNKSKAAELLGLSRKVLYEKIDAYKIQFE